MCVWFGWYVASVLYPSAHTSKSATYCLSVHQRLPHIAYLCIKDCHMLLICASKTATCCLSVHKRLPHVVYLCIKDCHILLICASKTAACCLSVHQDIWYYCSSLPFKQERLGKRQKWIGIGCQVSSFSICLWAKPIADISPNPDGQIFLIDKQSPSKWPCMDSLDDTWPQLYTVKHVKFTTWNVHEFEVPCIFTTCDFHVLRTYTFRGSYQSFLLDDCLSGCEVMV